MSVSQVKRQVGESGLRMQVRIAYVCCREVGVYRKPDLSATSILLRDKQFVRGFLEAALPIMYTC